MPADRVLCLAVPAREYYFAASSPADATTWANAIGSVISAELDSLPLSVAAAEKAAQKKAAKEAAAADKKEARAAAEVAKKRSKVHTELSKLHAELSKVAAGSEVDGAVQSAEQAYSKWEATLNKLLSIDFDQLSSEALVTGVSASKSDFAAYSKDLGAAADRALNATEKSLNTATSTCSSAHKALSKLQPKVTELSNVEMTQLAETCSQAGDAAKQTLARQEGLRLALRERRTTAKQQADAFRDKLTRLERDARAAQGAETEGERRFEALRSAAGAAAEECTHLQRATASWKEACEAAIQDARGHGEEFTRLTQLMQTLAAELAPESTVQAMISIINDRRLAEAAKTSEQIDAVAARLAQTCATASSLKGRLAQDSKAAARIRNKSMKTIHDRLAALKQHGNEATESQQQIVLKLPQIDEIEQRQVPQLAATLDTIHTDEVQRANSLSGLESLIQTAQSLESQARAAYGEVRDASTSKGNVLSGLAGEEADCDTRCKEVKVRLQDHTGELRKYDGTRKDLSVALQKAEQGTLTRLEAASHQLLQAANAAIAHREPQGPVPRLLEGAERARALADAERKKAQEHVVEVAALDKDMAKLVEGVDGLAKRVQAFHEGVHKGTRSQLTELHERCQAAAAHIAAFAEGNLVATLPSLGALLDKDMPQMEQDAAVLFEGSQRLAEYAHGLHDRVATLHTNDTEWRKLDKTIGAADEAREKSLKKQRKLEDDLAVRKTRLDELADAASTETRRLFALTLALKGDAPKLASALQDTERGLQDAKASLGDADAALKRVSMSADATQKVLSEAAKRQQFVQEHLDGLRAQREAQSKELSVLVRQAEKLLKEVNICDSKWLTPMHDDLAKLETMLAAAAEAASAHPDGNLVATLPDLTQLKQETVPRITSEYNQACAALEESQRQVESLTGQHKAIKGLDKDLKKQEKAVSDSHKAVEKDLSSSAGAEGSSSRVGGLKALSNLRRNTGGVAAQVFGIKLAVAAAVPPVIRDCVSWLLQYARATEGLFRVSADAMQLEQLRKQADTGQAISFAEGTSPHLVAGFLKLWLRQLPEPPVPFERYDEWLSTAISPTDHNHAKATLEYLASRLPGANRALLGLLLPLWGTIAKQEAQTRMSPQNLAVVFSPIMLYPATKEAESAGMQQAMAQITAVMSLALRCAQGAPWPKFCAGIPSGGMTPSEAGARSGAAPVVGPTLRRGRGTAGSAAGAAAAGVGPAMGPVSAGPATAGPAAAGPAGPSAGVGPMIGPTTLKRSQVRPAVQAHSPGSSPALQSRAPQAATAASPNASLRGPVRSAGTTPVLSPRGPFQRTTSRMGGAGSAQASPVPASGGSRRATGAGANTPPLQPRRPTGTSGGASARVTPGLPPRRGTASPAGARLPGVPAAAAPVSLPSLGGGGGVSEYAKIPSAAPVQYGVLLPNGAGGEGTPVGSPAKPAAIEYGVLSEVNKPGRELGLGNLGVQR